MKRNKHSLSHYKLVTCNMGQLVPVGVTEVLPGDTIQHATSALIRVSPLVAPVMHPCHVRFHSFFVPYRLVWDGWEDFITGGPDGDGGSSGAFPYIDAGGSGFAAKGLLDYLGVKPGVADIEVSALPVRAYQLIYNEFFRDQDLNTAATINTGSGADATTTTTLQRIAWEKDYFTSARPWAQKGTAVTLPLGTRAPVTGIGMADRSYGSLGVNVYETGQTTTTNYGFAQDTSQGGAVFMKGSAQTDGLLEIYADLSNATSVDVNTVREAFALQRMMEARAQYGSRYTEYLRYLGVRSSDARLQRPEYLGGGKQTISFSEVLQTAPTTDGDDSEGVGNLKGHGIAAMRSRRYRRFFEEHGVILTLMSVRPKTIYGDAVDRMWFKRTKEEFWQPELERIGQQEVYRREVYAQSDAAGGDTVFGYQDRYAEYRHTQSKIAGEFRDSTLYDWHFARLLGAAPTLNSSFINCDPGTRPFASTATDQLLVMVGHSMQARRKVGRLTIGRIF